MGRLSGMPPLCERFASKTLGRLCRDHDGLMLDDLGRPKVMYRGANDIPESEITDEMLDDEIEYSVYNNEDDAVHFADNTFVRFAEGKDELIRGIRRRELRGSRQEPRGYGKDTGYHGPAGDDVPPVSTRIRLQKNKIDDYRDKGPMSKWYDW